jgi:anti-sigma regulatory factor (Ser/Thr protein kinase)
MDGEVLDGDVRFCLVLPSEALSVPVMRRVLGGALLGFGADEDCVADILLAASEACTNVLRHGGHSTEYEVSASVGMNSCFLEIANGAGPGEPTAARYPDAKRPLNGAGKAEIAVGHLSGETSAVGHLSGETSAVGHLSGEKSTAPIPANGTSAAKRSGGSGDGGVDQLQESGRGLHIMRACVDDLTLRGTPSRGTVVSMRKRLTWAPEVTGRHAGAHGARQPAVLREAG